MNEPRTMHITKTTKLSVGHVTLEATIRNGTSKEDREFIDSLFDLMERHEEGREDNMLSPAWRSPS
jgi:hypothetical protein